MEVLEDIDLMFLRKLTKGHSKTAKEAFHMETGLLPIRFVCTKRRVMYLHNILTKPKKEMICKFYDVQKNIHTKNDWYALVQKNLQELDINLSEENISKMSKDGFRSLVEIAVDKLAMVYLNNVAQKHSKSEDTCLVFISIMY